MKNETLKYIPVTSAWMRQIDAYAIEKIGIPGIVLMENAGRAVKEAALEKLRKMRGKSVGILCGGGNNGGDGFVAARHLVNAGIKTLVITAFPDAYYKGDALINLQIIRRMNVPLLNGAALEKISSCDIVIDALLGTGTRGKIREPYSTLISAINDSRKPIIAVDVPSGLDADSGKPLGVTVKADITVTMGCPKKGLLENGAKKYVGKLTVADIGIPKQIINKFAASTAANTSPESAENRFRYS